MSVSSKFKGILIVEDEEEIRELMSYRLKKLGYRVICCDNVTEALKICDKQRFGCIILDYQLSKGGTGDQVVTALRKNMDGLNYATPLLMISAHLSAEIVSFLALHINSALVKPFDFTVFVERVKQLCPLVD